MSSLTHRAARLGGVLIAAAAILGIDANRADAAAFVPSDDDEVVAVLPPGARSLRAINGAVAADFSAVLPIAMRLVEQGQQNSDPRAFGRAEALLKRFADRDDVALMLTLAAIDQFRHRFDHALAKLQRVIDREPDHLSAWWMRAGIAQTTGRFELAAQACERLRAIGSKWVGEVCAADLASLRGDRSGYMKLRHQLSGAHGLQPAVMGWLANVLAEMADRFGDTVEAEAWHRLALRNAPTVYVKTAYADFLLAEQRPADALRVLAPRAELAYRTVDATTTVDSLYGDSQLLRLAIAHAALGQREAAKRAADSMKERLAAARLRGDAPHLREEAMVALLLDVKPFDALALARENWREQREPIDARILAQAARASGDEVALNELRGEFGPRIGADRRLAKWFEL